MDPTGVIEPIPGQPGLFRDPSNPEKVINIRDFREGDKYDTVSVAPGVQEPGTEYIFFQNFQQKREVDTNLKTPTKLSSGESMILDRIGLYIKSSTGITFPSPQDYKTIVDNAYYRLNINGLLQDEGPAVKFPSGYGLYGSTQENAQGIVSIGVPATASAARLIRKQLLNQNHELEGKLTFFARQWLTASPATFPSVQSTKPVVVNVTQGDEPLPAGVLVTNFLHGLIRAAVSK